MLLLCGCPKKDEPEFDPNDRLLQKMRAEQERLAKAPPKQPEPDPLAEIVARPSKPEALGIPAGVSADLGPVSLTLVEVEQAQTVGGGKVSLSTTERFLKVTLDAVSTKDVDLDLSGATLSFEDRSVPIARDAQRAAKGSPLMTKLDAGSRSKLVLFFEAPDEMIRKGLKIILTTPESRVELALQ
ncbi:MAG: hypothetical protein Q8L48_06955 [Archangium sp.]|nr:hypothetical protein [Archangium sp.]